MATDPAARAPASHVVVDGSNIATEGRTAPSLAQLDEAVTSFIAQYGHQKVTVIVDATFGHRIVAGERPDYEEAVLAGELVAPPAGTIGRGDAFILQVARLANADVLSNDSFQELHAEHPWLFETGRLFGGKPVPEVGWVFVSRSPVKGPVSRRATQSSKKARGRATVKASAAASAPMPVPTAPPPRARRGRGTAATTTAPVAEDALLEQAAAAILEPSAPDASAGPAVTDEAGDGDGRRGKRRRRGAGSGGGDTTAREPINDKLPYVAFVIEHPIGSVVQGVVERFSSHGAYVDLGEARGYVPLKALGDPPPRSAKEHFELGETRSFTVTRFDADLRGIDIVPVELVPALLGTEPAAAGLAEDGGYDVVAPTATEVPAPAGTGPAPSDAQEAPVSPAAKKATTRKAPAKKAATTAKKSAAKATVKKAAATATKAAATAKRAATTATKAAATATRSAAKAPAKKKASAAKAPAKKAATAAKSTAKARATKATAARKAPATKATATKATATKKKAPARAAKKA